MLTVGRTIQLTPERQRELMESLGQFDAPGSAALELAHAGIAEALPVILRSIRSDCAWEIIPEAKIDAYVMLASVECFPALLRELETLDESALDDDAGDIGDEFWRVQQSVEKILVGIGAPIAGQVSSALELTENSFARETLGNVLAAIRS